MFQFTCEVIYYLQRVRIITISTVIYAPKEYCIYTKGGNAFAANTKIRYTAYNEAQKGNFNRIIVLG